MGSNLLEINNLQMWLSVDPMSDKYPSMSPYNYCANNPVILVDPDGRDIYTFDDKGNIYLYEAIEGSSTDHLVVLDKNGKVSRDKNGNIKKESFFGKQLSQEVDKGSFDNISIDGKTLIDFKGKGKEASGVFNILADNSSVEWGIVGFKNADSETQFQVGSSHNSYFEGSASNVAIEKSNNGNLLVYNHSHPLLSTDGVAFGATGGFSSTKDKNYWNDVLQGSPKASLGIRFRGATVYHHNKPEKGKNLFR